MSKKRKRKKKRVQRKPRDWVAVHAKFRKAGAMTDRRKKRPLEKKIILIESDDN